MGSLIASTNAIIHSWLQLSHLCIALVKSYLCTSAMQMPDKLPGEHASLAFQPLERRVDLTALEYMDLEGEDAISIPEMNYWFTCPEGDPCFSGLSLACRAAQLSKLSGLRRAERGQQPCCVEKADEDFEKPSCCCAQAGAWH